MDRSPIDKTIATVCDAASDAMVVVRVEDGEVQHSNEAALSLFHEDGALLAREVSLAHEALKAGNVEARAVEIHGIVFSVRPQLVPLPDSDDLALLLLRTGSVNELTERLSLTYKAINKGIWDWDTRTNELVWSEHYMQMVGLDVSTFKPEADTFFDCLHPDDRPRIEKAVENHLVTREPFDVVYRQRHVDGSYIDVHALGQAVWDDQGKPTRMVGSVEDIGEQLATRKALNETETRFKHLAENIPGAIFRYMLRPDGSHEIEYMSPGCLDIWEVDAATIEGDPAALWAMIVEEDIVAVQESVAKSAEDLTPWNIVYRVVTPSGKHKSLHGRGLPRRRADGGVVWNTLVLDISDQVNMEAELRESRELFHRAQKSESLGQLTGGLAHDFNNLLAIILGNLELLSDRLDDEAYKVMLDSALNATRRGRDLTQSLLAFARRATLQPEPLAVDVVVEDLTRLLHRTLPASIDFETEVEEDLPRLALDRAAFESALLNLVLNARDAVGRNGRIRLGFSKRYLDADNEQSLPAGDYVAIEVSDDGKGISKEAIARVFEPFFTTKGEGKGTGLGLSIVDGFVSQSGGAISIDSVEGEGTTIFMLFPAHSGDAGETNDRVEATSSYLVTGSHTVLVVEDEPELRRMLCLRLETENYRVLSAADGEEAKKVFYDNRDQIDLVLTDYVMPGPVQGSDLANYVKAARSDMPVVLLSGFVDAADKDLEASGRNIDARLDKPVDKADLLSTLHELIMAYRGITPANDSKADGSSTQAAS